MADAGIAGAARESVQLEVGVEVRGPPSGVIVAVPVLPVSQKLERDPKNSALAGAVGPPARSLAGEL